MVHRSSPAPFLLKTYRLVDEPTTDEVISWNDSGTGFVVWKTADFAKDLLPNSFKHNNFSSFVRQLNTYGFHKTVPDKWEFANQYFKRGRKELLIKIHRRKTVAPPKGDGLGLASPHSSSGDDHGSISISSHDDSKSHGLADVPSEDKLENLSEENEKLRKEKECLKMEIAKAKQQCDDLMAFLTQCVKLPPEQITQIRNGDMAATGQEHDANDEDVDKEGDCFRLFGVLLKAEKKRGRNANNNETSGVQMKNMKLRDFNKDTQWMNRSCSVTEHYK